MSLEAYARNLYAPAQFIDASIVTIVATATGRDATRSSPNTSVSGTSTLTVTFPSAVKQISLGVQLINSTKTITSASLATANGVTTLTLVLSGALTSTEEAHMAFLVIGE